MALAYCSTSCVIYLMCDAIVYVQFHRNRMSYVQLADILSQDHPLYALSARSVCHPWPLISSQREASHSPAPGELGSVLL